ncbi:unnamed protein product, partial [Schistosoma guineensis]
MCASHGFYDTNPLTWYLFSMFSFNGALFSEILFNSSFLLLHVLTTFECILKLITAQTSLK